MINDCSQEQMRISINNFIHKIVYNNNHTLTIEIYIIDNSHSAGTDFSRQNLTSVDVRF